LAITTRELDDDASLVVAVQSGDTEAFAELFRRHYPSVRRACAHRLRDIGEADEIAQAAFVRALERIDRCGGERRFGGWVQVIAERLCIDAVRSRARTLPHEVPVEPEAAVVPHGPEDELLRGQVVRDLRAAIATLPPRQREVLVARDVEERRPPEIAAALGLSLGAVDSLLLRARRRLAGAYRATTGEQGSVNTASTAAIASAGVADGPRALGRALVTTVNAAHDLAMQLAANGASAGSVAQGMKRLAVAAATALTLTVPGLGVASHPTTPPSSGRAARVAVTDRAPGGRVDDVRNGLRDRLSPPDPSPGTPDLSSHDTPPPPVLPSLPAAPTAPALPAPPSVATPTAPAPSTPSATDSPAAPADTTILGVPPPTDVVPLPSTDPLPTPPPVAP
jgi:RNA polymerase sigma-70 factor (ECF subfamily)